MARPKLIEETKALELVRRYFEDVCQGNSKRLKTSEIVTYIQNNGYPEYNAVALRRSKEIRKLIEDLKLMSENDSYVTVVAYQSLDANEFIKKYRSIDSLIKALTERDAYYKRIADSAVDISKRYEALAQKYESEKAKSAELEAELSSLKEQTAEYRKIISQIKKDFQMYKSLVDTYVYPEMANELLVKEGAIKKTANIVDSDAAEADLIHFDTNIRNIINYDNNNDDNGNSVIDSMYNL